ncbi:hypothetical protein ACIBP6_40215 [Nonomuraea terrae]|uniref:hypothetical protein n=1 Tax=Nonomuraea terrae TaxID=2530383 RepID=UPI0037A857DB
MLSLPSPGRSRATLGQHAVRPRRTRPDGARPGARIAPDRDGARPGARIVPALLSGGFGYCLLIGLAPFAPAAGGPATLLLLATLTSPCPAPTAAFPGLVAGPTVTDSRPGGGERREMA